MDVGLAPTFFVLMVSATAVYSQIAKGPVNALKNVGDSVTLECVTSSKNCDDVEWVKMEGVTSPRTVYRNGIGILHTFNRERYSVNSSGGCNLTITQLQISDSGRFSCVLTIDATQETRGCILVVIDVTESCRSNSSNNELTEGDSYSFWTAINVPAKSVDPSNVRLSFHNMAVGEMETMNDSQPLTVKTTLTGIARKENITQRVCRASFPPNTAADFDRTHATLVICTTPQLIVSSPVDKIAVSPSGPYYNNCMVRCTAGGQPSSTFKWTHLKSGQVVDGDTLVINGDPGDEYTCTATNTVKGKGTSQIITIEVSSPPQSHGASIIVGIGIGVSGMLIFVWILFGVLCRRYEWIKRTKTDDTKQNVKEEESERSRINRDDSETPQYEPLNVLLSRNSNAAPTYEELTTLTKIDITGQSVSSRANREDKLNEKESGLTEYESFQQRELSPSDAYECIKPKQWNKNKKF